MRSSRRRRHPSIGSCGSTMTDRRRLDACTCSTATVQAVRSISRPVAACRGSTRRNAARGHTRRQRGATCRVQRRGRFRGPCGLTSCTPCPSPANPTTPSQRSIDPNSEHRELHTAVAVYVWGVGKWAFQVRLWPPLHHHVTKAARSASKVSIPAPRKVMLSTPRERCMFLLELTREAPSTRADDPIRGDDGTRTHNPHLAKVVRYQLRHVPEAVPG